MVTLCGTINGGNRVCDVWLTFGGISQERKLDWFPRLRTSSLDTTGEDADTLDKWSALFQEATAEINATCASLKALQMRKLRTGQDHALLTLVMS